MRRSADFEQAVRRGARGGRDSLVVHLTTRTDPGPGPVVGFVVSKAVGTAVTRNLVRRRLRGVRALPPAAGRPYASLGSDLDAALAVARRRAAQR
jgi:ribonuclease P protein component